MISLNVINGIDKKLLPPILLPITRPLGLFFTVLLSPINNFMNRLTELVEQKYVGRSYSSYNESNSKFSNYESKLQEVSSLQI